MKSKSENGTMKGNHRSIPALWAAFFAAVLVLPLPARAKFTAGFYLSIGPLHYSFAGLPDMENPDPPGKPNDLFLGFSLYFKNRFELNVVYNRATGEITHEYRLMTYDKDGFGIELGKVVSIDLFKKGSLAVSTEFAAGAYALFYPFLNVQYTDLRFGVVTPGEGKSQYQLGFYWTVRLKNLVAGKASIDLGFKSLIPFGSDEFASLFEEEVFLSRNFLYIGISF